MLASGLKAASILPTPVSYHPLHPHILPHDSLANGGGVTDLPKVSPFLLLFMLASRLKANPVLLTPLSCATLSSLSFSVNLRVQ